MVKKIQASGAKTDVIGMQGHWRLESPSLEEIVESIVAFVLLGIKVVIKELEIDILSSPAALSGAELSQNAELEAR
jgi:endo-1,4-beta-xylanase